MTVLAIANGDDADAAQRERGAGDRTAGDRVDQFASLHQLKLELLHKHGLQALQHAPGDDELDRTLQAHTGSRGVDQDLCRCRRATRTVGEE